MDGRVSPLMSVETLAGIASRPRIRLLDIRSAVDGGGRAAFEAGHIPGSVHTDYVKDGWRAVRGGGAGMLPEPAALAALLGRVGLAADSYAIVVPAGVSAGDLAAASRVFWTLRAAGHEAIAMLDGGFAAWASAGMPVETGPGASPAATDYEVRPQDGIRARLDEVERAVADGSATLVDTRNLASFVGDEISPQAARGGRLPGSLRQEGAQAFDPTTKRIKPKAELESLFGDLPDGPVIAFCNTGQQASTNWFVLSELLRRPDVKLYDGSMSEWTADPNRPVETGPAR